MALGNKNDYADFERSQIASSTEQYKSIPPLVIGMLLIFGIVCLMIKILGKKATENTYKSVLNSPKNVQVHVMHKNSLILQRNFEIARHKDSSVIIIQLIPDTIIAAPMFSKVVELKEKVYQ